MRVGLPLSGAVFAKGIVYASGLAQGVALVAYPAAGNLFTSAEGYHLSHAAYGALFLPQTLLSVVFSLLMARFAGVVSLHTLLYVGLLANLFSMGLFAVSALFMNVESIALPLLLLGTSLLGVGFGITVPTLNTMAALLSPQAVDNAILGLNALLGLGTALAPLLIAFFTFIGLWWGLPLSSFVLFGLLLVFSMKADFSGMAGLVSCDRSNQKRRSPVFCLFALFALFYGIVETINGNWSVIAMRQLFHASASDSSFGLMAFWGMVTVGRLGFALVSSNRLQQAAFCVLPLVAALSFFLIGISSAGSFGGILFFALAGLGCSALLPLTISLAVGSLPQMRQSIAGSMIGLYLCGYGIAAFGVGLLNSALQVPLNEIFLAGALVAFSLSLLAIAIKWASKVTV